MSTIATICARGGSTGLPGKNIRPLFGKPLIAHTIEQALRTPGIDRVFVSTDDDAIAAAAREAGAEIGPPPRTMVVGTAMGQTVRHCMELRRCVPEDCRRIN